MTQIDDRPLPIDEIVRLARVAAHECPADEPMVTDWMDAAMKVCRAIAAENPIVALTKLQSAMESTRNALHPPA